MYAPQTRERDPHGILTQYYDIFKKCNDKEKERVVSGHEKAIAAILHKKKGDVVQSIFKLSENCKDAPDLIKDFYTKAFLTLLIPSYADDNTAKTSYTKQLLLNANVEYFKDFKDYEKMDGFFSVLQERNALEVFQIICNEDRSPIPPLVANEFSEWLDLYKIELKTQARPRSSVETDHDGTPVTMVAGSIVRREDSEWGSSGYPERREHVRNPYPSSSTHEPQHRRKHALDLLKSKGLVVGDGVDVYQERSSEHENPYSLIDIDTPNLRAQILLGDHHLTYVNRDPSSFHSMGDISIDDLQGQDTVWQFQKFNEGQWLRDLERYIFTPLDNLDIQIKHRMKWPDKDPHIIDSAIAEIINTGEMPKSRDETHLLHGKLSSFADANWHKVFYAIQDKRIPFFVEKNINTWTAFRDYLTKENLELESFEGHPLLASDLLKTLADNIAAKRSLFDLSRAFGSVAGHTRAELDFALPHLDTHSVQKFLNGHGLKPCKTMDSFAIATGLATGVGHGHVLQPEKAASVLAGLQEMDKELHIVG